MYLKFLILAQTTLNQQITSAFDENIPSILSGTLFSGLGEGAYYISLPGYKKQFISKLGFEPYPGTLNLKISDVFHKQFFDKLSNNDGILIEGFTDKKRTYGNVKCFPCTINSNIQGSIIVIERTHHDLSLIHI